MSSLSTIFRARRFWLRVALPVLVALAVSCVELAACAQAVATEDVLEEARRQYREGLSLEAAGDWARALTRFESVARVRLTPQVRFHIARNKEKLGRLTEALGDYRLAEYEATDISESELSEIREARESLENRVPKLQMTAIGSIAGATILLDGVEIGKDSLGTALPVDPGQHRVVVTFEDGTSREYVVQVREGMIERLDLEGRPDASDLAPPLPPAAPTIGRDRSWWPWVAAGAGTASLAAGGVLLYLRQEAIDDLDAGCTGRVCSEEYEETYTSGRTYSVLAPIALGAGVVGVGAAVLGFTVLAPNVPVLDTSSRSLTLKVGALSGKWGVEVRGGF